MDDSTSAPPPPPFDPLTPAVPISYPLKTLEELESRAYFKSFHFPFNQAAVKLPSGGDQPLPRRSRILVCHDMSGGYTDDRLVQGGTNADAYAIWHWHLIDVFVYFSHNLVTLPPPCWTNAAHRHGVKVLGTLIMEWDDGAEIAEKLLSTKASAQLYAERLSELAVALGFDGWLINMEVDLDPVRVPILLDFVSHLTQTMHSSSPGSMIIWYDSVTVDGELNWQNQLNAKNKPFFDRCDGIFVNYSWEEDYPKLSAEVAGERKYDVYMGIDVWGRGTYGEGGWTTNVALDVIKKDSISAAIFAPGWVYETKQEPNFQAAQNRWWGLVEKSIGSVQNYPKLLPFYSNFDQGRGYHISVEGKQVSNAPWNNLSSQSFQPFIEYHGDSATQPIQVLVNFKEPSYNGGGNITFRGSLGNNVEFAARLFKGEILMENSPIYFTYSVNSSANSMLGLVLEFSSTTTEENSVFVADSRSALPVQTLNSNHFMYAIMPYKVKEVDGWIIQNCSIQMRGRTLKGINALCYRNKQTPISSEYYAILGDIKISNTRENPKFPPSTSWIIDGEFIHWSSAPKGSKHLSFKITWKLKDWDAILFDKYNIYLETQSEMQDLLGVVELRSFYVSDLQVFSGTKKLKFIIQVFSLDGSCTKIQDSPFFVLQVPGRLSDYGLKLSKKVAESVKASKNSFMYIYDAGYNKENNCGDTKVEGCNMFQRLVGISVQIQGIIYFLLLLISSALAFYIACHFCI